MTVQSAQHKDRNNNRVVISSSSRKRRNHKISNPESRLLKPIICITCDRRNQGPTTKNTTKIRPPRAEVFIKEALVQNVIQAGGVPF